MTTGFFSLGGSSGGTPTPQPDNTYQTDYFTLTPTNITNKSVTLFKTPTTPSETVLNVVGGAAQYYGVAFTVTGATLSWSGLGLDGVLIAGDQLVVEYPIVL